MKTQYSGKLISAITHQKRAPGSIRVRTAENAETSIVKQYNHIEPQAEYTHVPFTSRWKKVSDTGSHKLETKVSKPAPKRASPQKQLAKRVSPLKLKEGRKPKPTQSISNGAISLPAHEYKPKYRIGSSFSKEFHQKVGKGWTVNKITHTLENHNPIDNTYTIKITELLSKVPPKREKVKEHKVKEFTARMIAKADAHENAFRSGKK